ncbi:MAG: rod shape-determining protein [Fusobacteriaceae bacterium]|jgi:cell division protein FtsA|nr:rod shape-determining protein [Fusobacteriaceae bacterium]
MLTTDGFEKPMEKQGFHSTKTVIDIGNAQIKGIVGEINYSGTNDQLSVSVLKYKEIESGGLVRSEITAEYDLISAVAVVLDALRVSERPVDKVSIGLGGAAFKTARATNRLVTEYQAKTLTEEDIEDFYKKAQRELLSPGDRVIHREMYNIRVNDKPTASPVGRVADTLRADVYFIYMEEAAYRRYEDLFRKIPDGPAIERIMANGYTAAMALLRNEEKNAGVILADIGWGTTDIVIFKRNWLLDFESIPFGMMHFILDLCKLPQFINYKDGEQRYTAKSTISQEYAEELLELYIQNKIGAKETFFKETVYCRGEYILELIAMRCEHIAEEIKKVLPNLNKDLKKGIILTGGGSRIYGLAEKIKEKTGHSVVCNALPFFRFHGLPEVDERMAAVIGLFGEAIEAEYERALKAGFLETDGDTAQPVESDRQPGLPDQGASTGDPKIDEPGTEQTGAQTGTGGEEEPFVPPQDIPPSVSDQPTGDDIDEAFQNILGNRPSEKKKPEPKSSEDKRKIKDKVKIWWQNIKENYMD